MNPIYDILLDELRVRDSEGSLPAATQPGTTVAYNGAEWESRYGEKHVTVTGDFLGENGYLYVLNLENDMTVRIGAVNSLEDYAFDLLVFQGSTVRQLTLLGDHYPIWWAAGDWYPQSYSSENMPPAMDEANTGYLVHCTWSSDARVLLAEVSKTFDATRGVVVDSAGVLITSAMTYTGGTIGVGDVANHVTVYNRGVATGQTVVSGGGVYVSGGGIASNTNIAHANGQMQVFVGGVAVSPTVDSGTLSVERGTVDGFTANGGSVTATSNAIISGGTITQSGVVTVTESEIDGVGVGGTLTLSSGGVATSAVVTSGGTVTVSSGGVTSAATVSSGGWAYVSNGGVANTTVVRGGSLAVRSGGVVNETTVSSGGAFLNSGGVASSVILNGSATVYSNSVTDLLIISSGVTVTARAESLVKNVTVCSGGALSLRIGAHGSSVEIEGSAGLQSDATIVDFTVHRALTVGEGASATSGTVYSGGFFVADGSVFDVIVSSGGQMNVTGVVSNFASVDGATVRVSSGGSATTNGTAYGVSVAEGGALTVESGGLLNIQSGKTAYGVTVIGGSAVVKNGGMLNGAVVSAGSINVSAGGSALNINTVGAGGLNIENGYASGIVNRWATFVYGGTVENATQRVNAFTVCWGSASRVVVSGGRLDVGNYPTFGKATAADVTVSSGGSARVFSSGTVSAPTILNGGTLTVSAGGSADYTDVKSGGYMHILAGGVATNTTAEEGATVVDDNQ